MSTFGLWACFFIGLVITVNSVGALDHMNGKTNHLMRLAYFLMSVGGMSLVIAPFAKTEPWLAEFGIVSALLGVCLVTIFGRRERLKEHP